MLGMGRTHGGSRCEVVQDLSKTKSYQVNGSETIKGSLKEVVTFCLTGLIVSFFFS